jgi:hypothetical protein
MRELLAANRGDLALVIGNGINRFDAPATANSWEDLLSTLARTCIGPAHRGVPAGVSPTEFYDIVDLAAARAATDNLQSQFCKLMAGWTPLPQHGFVTAWARRWSVPILTTNFESTLAEACGARLRRCGSDRFTAFYPWSSCFAPAPVDDPLKSFAIWHVNGQQRYRQSIRLGLAHYMGSVERARGWMQRSGSRLFRGDDIRNWPGARTWLQAFLHKPLLFMGLGLEQNEVFLRWLLIERARYFNRFPARRQAGWYVHAGPAASLDAGKAFFLRGVGIEPVAVKDYAQIYGGATWR